MLKKREKSSNMKLAGLFILLVFSLVLLSLLFKIIFLIRDSKFDSAHKFNVAFIGKNTTEVASFSPNNKSISILGIETKFDKKTLAKYLLVPIDGVVYVDTKSVDKKNISSTLFKAIFPLGIKIEQMTTIDALRLFLFSRGVNSNSIYLRELSENLNENQKSTLISLSFTDPEIYQESQSIEIINSTDVFGLGGRLATFITNIGGNVVLVTSDYSDNNKSKIIYFGEETYTIKKLSSVLGFPKEKSDKRGIAAVIIIIGKDKVNNIIF